MGTKLLTTTEKANYDKSVFNIVDRTALKAYKGTPGQTVLQKDIDLKYEWVEPQLDDNGVTVINVTGDSDGSWKAIYNGAINIEWGGAKPYTDYNNAENCFEAMQKCFNLGGKHFTGSKGKKYMAFQPDISLTGSDYIGLRVQSGTTLDGGFTIDFSHQLNPLWASGIIEIVDDVSNITIDGVIFDQGGNRPEASTIKGESSGISIGKYGNGNISNITITHCKFDNISYSGWVAEPHTIQENWDISDNEYVMNSQNYGSVTTGAQHAWDIICIHPYDIACVKGCKIQNNTIKLTNGTNGGTFYKILGLVDSIVDNNICITDLDGTGTTTSGDLEIGIKDSVFSRNIVDKSGSNGVVFNGCENVELTDNIYHGDVILSTIDWRDNSGSLSSNNMRFSGGEIKENLGCVSSEQLTNIKFNNVTIDHVGTSNVDGIEFSDCNINTFSAGDATTFNMKIYNKTKINTLTLYETNDLTSTVTLENIDLIDPILQTNSYYIMRNCTVSDITIQGAVESKLIDCTIKSLSDSSIGVVLKQVTFDKCRFYGSADQTGNYIVNPTDNAILIDCKYYGTTFDGGAVTHTGHINPLGNCTILGDLSNFDEVATYNIYDPNGYAKSSFNIAEPTTRDYEKYFRIYNFNAVNSGDDLGWICTTAGTAGDTAVFKSIGTIA